MAIKPEADTSKSMVGTPNIVLFGGTFDPVHNGHITIAKWLRGAVNAERVIMIPAGDPYLRTVPPIASTYDRLHMVQLAVAGEPGIEVSDIDAVRAGPTYSIDTVRDMRRVYGSDAEYLLAVGIDAANSLHRWHRYDDLADACTFLIIERPGISLDPTLELPPQSIVLRGPMMPISASSIRGLYASGRADAAAECIPDPVHTYIIERGIYRCATIKP